MHKKSTIIWRLFLILLLFTVGCMGPGTAYRARPVPPLQSNDPYAHIQMAEKYLVKFFNEDSYFMENLDIVVRESNEALRLSPQMAEAFYFLGYGTAFKGIVTGDELKIQNGLSEFNKSIERRPSLGNSGPFFPLPFMVARYYFDKNKTAKAIQYVQEAIRLDPDIMQPHLLLGTIYSSEQKYELALQEYRMAVNLSPEDPEAAKHLAATYILIVESATAKKNATLYKNVITKAIKATKNAVRLAPDDALMHEALGVLYGASGLHDLKLFEIQTVIEQGATASAYYELGSAYMGKNLLQKAEQNFLKALEIEPDYDTAQFCLAYSHYLMNDYDKACDVFKKYFKSKKSPEVYRAIWYYYSILANGNSSQATDFLKKYSKGFNGNQWEKALLDYHLGKLDDAGLISKTTQVFDQCEAYYYIGCRHFHAGDNNKAKEYFQKVLETKIYDYYEYSAANARLSQLK